MKQASDQFTADLYQARGRGRPRKPDALTPAQRARAYRQRCKAAHAAAAAELGVEFKASQKIAPSNFRDASRKIPDQAQPWYFPGTREWCAQHGVEYKGAQP